MLLGGAKIYVVAYLVLCIHLNNQLILPIRFWTCSIGPRSVLYGPSLCSTLVAIDPLKQSKHVDDNTDIELIASPTSTYLRLTLLSSQS